MSRKPAENPPLFPEEPLAEVAYCHDGSLEGLLSAVFEAYARREDPQDVARADVLQPRLGQTVRVIETNEEHAVRVRRGIRRACGDAAYDAVKHASLSDHPDAAPSCTASSATPWRRAGRTIAPAASAADHAAARAGSSPARARPAAACWATSPTLPSSRSTASPAPS